MTKVFVSTVILLLAITMTRPVSADELGTFVRVHAHVDVSGRTELVIHKAYAGQLGPIRDIISLQDSGPDGYPKVEIVTSGAVKASRESGGIIVESTGSGLGAVDVYVTFNRLRSSWWIQVPEAPGVGAMRLNATATFGDGVHRAQQGNQVLMRSPDGRETPLVEGAHRKGWSVNTDIAAGSSLLFEVAGESDRVAPLWMTQASLGLALLSLALSVYLVLKLRTLSR